MHEVWKRKQIHEDAKENAQDQKSRRKAWKMEKTTLGRSRPGQKNGQAECRKCSAYARQRVGPKLMHCCRLEPMGTQEYGRMLKRIQVVEDGRVQAKDARSCRIEGQKKRTTRKEYQRLLNKFEVASFLAQIGLWNLVREKGVAGQRSVAQGGR